MYGNTVNSSVQPGQGQRASRRPVDLNLCSAALCSALFCSAKSVCSTITTTRTRHGVGKGVKLVAAGKHSGKQAVPAQVVEQEAGRAGGRGGRDWQRC